MRIFSWIWEKMHRNLLLILVSGCGLLSITYADILVRTNNGTEITIHSVQILYRDNPMQPLSAPISMAFSTSMDDAFNKTLILPIARTMDDIAVMAQDNGAAAMIGFFLQGLSPGMNKFRIHSKETALSVRIPVFSVTGQDQFQLADLLNNNQVVNIEIIPEDPFFNPWDDVFLSGGMIAGNVLVMLLYSANIALAIWKLVLFGRYYGAKITLALVVITCELAANILRFLSGIDPFGQNYIYYNERIAQGFGTCSYPFAVSAFLLLSLYWHQMMTSGSLQIASFLTKMKIPFFVIAGVLIAISVLGNILYATTPVDVNSLMGMSIEVPNRELTKLGIVYVVILAICVAFYAVAGGMVLKKLVEMKKQGKTVRLQRITIKILISGACYVAFMIGMLISAVGVIRTPLDFVTVFGVTYVALSVASMFNILSFEPPSQFGSSKSTKNSNNSNSAGSKDSRKSRTNSGTYSASGTDASYDTRTEATNTPVV